MDIRREIPTLETRDSDLRDERFRP